MITPLEILGYVASGITALSLTMSNVWKLRWINLIGAAGLMVYSYMLQAWPLTAVNGFIVFVDLWYIWELYARKDMFTLLTTSKEHGTLLPVFLDTYRSDIAKFFPDFLWHELRHPKCLFILRNLTPVGLFIYEREGPSSARIHLDYVIPTYRDLANARFLYNKNYTKFLEEGFKEFVVRKPTPAHERFLLKMGFTRSQANVEVFVKPLASSADFAKRRHGSRLDSD